MAWNPFRAIGDAIGRVFGRGEQAPAPAPEPAPPAVVPERRGGLAGLLDRITGAERRREEAEREHQLAERERQIEERERQVEERQRQVEEREQAIPPTPPAPPPQAPAPERELPKFGADVSDFIARDERAFGTDSEIERELQRAVDDFIMDRGGLDDLSVDAQEWLQSPTISQPFSEYWSSGGFTAEQVLEGMTNISNITIVEGEDGDIEIEFDYDAEVDGYEVHGHASS